MAIVEYAIRCNTLTALFSVLKPSCRLTKRLTTGLNWTDRQLAIHLNLEWAAYKYFQSFKYFIHWNIKCQLWAAVTLKKNMPYLESGKKCHNSKWIVCGKNMPYFKCGKKASQFRMSSRGKNMLCFKCGKKASLWEKTCSIWKSGKKRPTPSTVWEIRRTLKGWLSGDCTENKNDCEIVTYT